MKGTLLALLVAGVVLSVPALALATDAPSPAAAACQAEYLQLGADAFKAKYGATEAYGNCLRAHGDTTNSPTTTPSTQPPATNTALAACEAEYKQVGVDAFKAKYGATEASLACIRAHGGTTNIPPPPTTTTPPTGGPEAVCKAEYLQIGADAFKAKYGVQEPFGACVKGHAGATQNSGEKPKSGDTTARAAASVAQALCSAEGQSLGRDAFQAKYGKGKDGLAACVGAAQGKAQSILAACTSKTTGDALKQCLQAALKSARAR